MTVIKNVKYFLITVCMTISDSNLIAKPPQIFNFLNYTVKFYKQDRTKDIPLLDKVEIKQGSKIVDQLESYFLELISLGYLKFRDDQSSKPYIIIGGHSGGAHGARSLHIYALTPSFKKILSYENDGNLSIELELPRGQCIIKATDQSFLYWHASYAHSAIIPLYFKLGLKGLEPCEECRSEYIDRKSALKLAKSFYEDPDIWKTTDYGKDPFYPGVIVQQVVTLIYNNRPELAQEFLEEAWNTKNPYKEQFKKDLKELLKKNSYWKYLEEKGYRLPW
jgi:hypothetical protein